MYIDCFEDDSAEFAACITSKRDMIDQHFAVKWDGTETCMMLDSSTLQTLCSLSISIVVLLVDFKSTNDVHSFLVVMSIFFPKQKLQAKEYNARSSPGRHARLKISKTDDEVINTLLLLLLQCLSLLDEEREGKI